jgi:hypothetical protein
MLSSWDVSRLWILKAFHAPRPSFALTNAHDPDLDLIVSSNRITENFEDTLVIGTVGPASGSSNRGVTDCFISDTRILAIRFTKQWIVYNQGWNLVLADDITQRPSISPCELRPLFRDFLDEIKDRRIVSFRELGEVIIIVIRFKKSIGFPADKEVPSKQRDCCSTTSVCMIPANVSNGLEVLNRSHLCIADLSSRLMGFAECSNKIANLVIAPGLHISEGQILTIRIS